MNSCETSIPEKAPGAKIFSAIPTRTESYGWLGRLFTSFTPTEEDNLPSVKEILKNMGKEEACEDIANIVYMANVLRQQVPHSSQLNIWSTIAFTMVVLKVAGALAEKAYMKCKLSLKAGTIVAEDGSVITLHLKSENKVEDYIVGFIHGLGIQDFLIVMKRLIKFSVFEIIEMKTSESIASLHTTYLLRLLVMSRSARSMRLYVPQFSADLLEKRSKVSKLFNYALFLDRSDLARVLVGHLDENWKAHWSNRYAPRNPRVSMEHGMAIINTVFKLISDTLERSEIERYLNEPGMRTLSGE